MLGSGVFQLWMVASTPPLKHCSPLELMVTHSTAPLQRAAAAAGRRGNRQQSTSAEMIQIQLAHRS